MIHSFDIKSGTHCAFCYLPFNDAPINQKVSRATTVEALVKRTLHEQGVVVSFSDANAILTTLHGEKSAFCNYCSTRILIGRDEAESLGRDGGSK